MGMTADVKGELSRVAVRCASVRKAEVTAFLRFSGALRVMGGRAVIRAEIDQAVIAQRMARDLRDLFGHEALILHRNSGSTDRQDAFVLVASRDAEGLARQTGLLDHRGRPAFGLPAYLVRGGVDDAAGVWRGAFMAGGSLHEIGRLKGFSVRSPAAEAGLALVGMGRKLGVAAKARDCKDGERVVVRDDADVETLLATMGAPEAGRSWVQRRQRAAATPKALQANFESANARRSAEAAADAVDRVREALTLLGDSAPDHLVDAGRLRLQYPHDSLEQLGRKAEPPMSKDTVAGRIRRLLSMAGRAVG